MSLEGRFRRVYSREWHEAAFRRLDDHERVVYFYARTGPQSTSVGIYRLSTAVAVEEIGNVTGDQFEQRLGVLCEAFGWRFDWTVRVFWIPSWCEENPPQSANVVVSWRKLLENVPDCELKLEAVEAIYRYLKDSPTIKNNKSYLDAFGDLPRRLRATFRNSEAQPQIQAGPIQGAGIRDLSGNRDQAAVTEADARLLSDVRMTARETVEFCDGHESPELVNDYFWQFWNRKHANRRPTRTAVDEELRIAWERRQFRAVGGTR